MSLDSPPIASNDERAVYDALLARNDWASLSKRLTRFVFAWTKRRSWHKAEEIAQEAIRQALDPAYKTWNPVLQPDLFRFLAGLAIGIVANQRRGRAEQRERLLKKDEDLARMAGADDADVENEVATRERATKALAALRARVHDDATCAALIVALEEGIDGPEAMAEATGIALEEVKTARRRLARHLEAVVADLDREEDGRG